MPNRGFDEDLISSLPKSEAQGPDSARLKSAGEGPGSSRPVVSQEEIPKIVARPEATEDSLTHEDFVDLIEHISRSEQRKGLKVPDDKKDEDA